MSNANISSDVFTLQDDSFISFLQRINWRFENLAICNDKYNTMCASHQWLSTKTLDYDTSIIDSC